MAMTGWRGAIPGSIELLVVNALDLETGGLLLPEAEPVPADIDLDRISEGGDLHDPKLGAFSEPHLLESFQFARAIQDANDPRAHAFFQCRELDHGGRDHLYS